MPLRHVCYSCGAGSGPGEFLGPVEESVLSHCNFPFVLVHIILNEILPIGMEKPTVLNGVAVWELLGMGCLCLGCVFACRGKFVSS